MEGHKSENPHGTLHPMILKTLLALRPLQGIGIARPIEQVNQDVSMLNEVTVGKQL